MYILLCAALIFGLINGNPLETRSKIYPNNPNGNAGHSGVTNNDREGEYNPNVNYDEQNLNQDKQYDGRQQGPTANNHPNPSYQDPNYNERNDQNPARQQPTANNYPNKFYQDPNFNVRNEQNPPNQNAPTHNKVQNWGEPNNEPGNAQFGSADPSNYDTVNIGNGVNRKNNVVLNQRDEYDEVLVQTGKKKNTNHHQTQGVQNGFNNSRKPGQQPCNQYGASLSPKDCNPQSGIGYEDDVSHGVTYYPPPRNYNIGNGYNNENVVTINTRGNRPTPYGKKPNRNTEIVGIYDDGSGISYYDDKSASHYSIGNGHKNKNGFLSFFGLS